MKNKRSDKFKSILELLAQGMTNQEIADKLGFKLVTIKKDISFLIEKYKVKSRTQLACEYLAQKFANN